MTFSSYDRRTNVKQALIAFLNQLGDRPFVSFYIQRGDFPDVFPTTWTELLRNGLLEDMDWSIETYRFTAIGYLRALNVSGRSEEPEFREGLGKICSVLKDDVKDRTNFAYVSLQDLVARSGVSEAFAYNTIEADLIQNILGRIGARWEGEHFIKVPNDFGLTVS